MTKIAVITCQPDPDYIRARTIRAGILQIPGWKLTVVKNSKRGILRYPEVAFKLLKTRLTLNPDVYLLTFRGYEMLPWLLVIALGKRVIFDEYINALEWVAYEHKKFNPNGIIGKIFNLFYGWLLKRCDTLLTDTDAHADLSAELSHVPRTKYFALPVGTDETVFYPEEYVANKDIFNVFFFGNILPLHGLGVIIDAARRLKAKKNIHFILVGGKPKHQLEVEKAINKGANIEYIKYLPFDELPKYVHSAGICLGGPFGNTFQSQYVVSTKTYQFLASAAPTIVGESKSSSVFKDKVNCLLVPQGDGPALTHAILWAYENQNELATIGKAGRELYEAKFSNTIIALRLNELLR